MKNKLTILFILLFTTSYSQSFISSNEYIDGEKTNNITVVTLSNELVKVQWIDGIKTSTKEWKVRKHISKDTGDYYLLKNDPVQFALEGNDIKVYIMDRNRVYHVDIQYLNVIKINL